MNAREHLLNALALGIGLGVVLAPSLAPVPVLRSIVAVTVPVVIGALVPDADVVIGSHRKTLHNLPVLAGFAAFPLVFGNLAHVWVGILAHLVLDMVGSTRGVALFYPLWRREFGVPGGVTCASPWAPRVTVLITGAELLAVALVIG